MEAIFSDKLAIINKNIGSHSVVDFYNVSKDYLINEGVPADLAKCISLRDFILYNY